MDGKISIRKYAKDCGCSDTAVHKAIRAGKIIGGVWRDENGKPWIIPDIANKEWKFSREISGSKSERIDKAVEAKAPKNSAVEPTLPPVDGGLVLKMNTAKVVKMTAEAQIKQLEYKKKAGILVEKEKVYSALYAAGQEVRSALQIIPDRWIDAIFGAKDRNEAHTILTQAIAEALETLSDAEKKDVAA